MPDRPYRPRYEAASRDAMAKSSASDAPAGSPKRARKRTPAGGSTKPTIRAVAERAEVAISTVSRVVNNGRVSPLVRRRVQRVIKELGYSPSVAAQALVQRLTGCIGLAVNSSQSPWFAQILAGIETALAPSRKSVLLASMMLHGHYDPQAVLAWIKQGRVDGLIVVRYSRRDQPLLDAAAKAGLPVVLIAPDVAAPVNFTVRCDNLSAGRLVGKHLAELGHQRVAFAGGPEESVDTCQRLEGLREALRDHGVSIDPSHILFASGYAPAAGVEYAERFLALPPRERPTAVVLGNDPMALGCMRTLLQHGVQVPQEVSVMGFDGTPDGEQCWPGLSTVRQPTQRMATMACQGLLECIERRPSDGGNTSVEFAVELLLRESTAPPRKAEFEGQGRCLTSRQSRSLSFHPDEGPAVDP